MTVDNFCNFSPIFFKLSTSCYSRGIFPIYAGRLGSGIYWPAALDPAI